MRIPRGPEALRLAVERAWDGSACADRRLHGELRLSRSGDGLVVEARLPHQATPRVPDQPPGTRVANLWEYDVVECFLVGAGGRYLEVELGAGGHFLVLSFSAPRVRIDDHADLDPRLRFEPGVHAWRSTIELPEALIPPGLQRLNAFVIASGHFLAWHPVPGAKPDFHQPERFPRVDPGS